MFAWPSISRMVLLIRTNEHSRYESANSEKPMKRELTERQKLLLTLIVHEHTRTTQPVGSKSLVKQYGLNISSASPGWVLLAKLIQWAITEGLTELDMMRGDEDYKYKFGGMNRYVSRIELVPPKGIWRNEGLSLCLFSTFCLVIWSAINLNPASPHHRQQLRIGFFRFLIILIYQRSLCLLDPPFLAWYY